MWKVIAQKEYHSTGGGTDVFEKRSFRHRFLMTGVIKRMSESWIILHGKLEGAVTRVLVNDLASECGIVIKTMFAY